MNRANLALCGLFVVSTLAFDVIAAEFIPPPVAERESVALLTKQGARVQVDGDYRVSGILTSPNTTNDDLKLLATFERPFQLQISSSKVTDAGLSHLKNLKQISSIVIFTSGVTNDGIAALRTALPDCRITTPSTRSRPESGPASSAPGGGGPRTTGTSTGTFRGAGSGAVTSRTSLLRSSEVQTGLKLTDEQRKQIAAASDFTALMRASEEKVVGVLTSEQGARLKQIELQQAGAQGLLRENIVTELKLSPDQQAAIRKLGSDLATSIRTSTIELTPQSRSDGRSAESQAKVREKVAELQKHCDDEILKVLNEEQRQKWLAMIGPKGPIISRTPFGSASTSRISPEALAKAFFDRYDADQDGKLTDAEFPSTNRSRQSMTRAGVTLEFPVAREVFEKSYADYVQRNRRPE